MSSGLEVDNRLFQIWGLRPMALHPQDLPDLARAIVGLYRKQATVTIGTSQELSYVLITGTGLKVQVLASDWAKINPYIQDGSFDPLAFPNARPANDLANLSPKDPYYLRILGTLQGLFPAP